jgi:hypothetical protein
LNLRLGACFPVVVFERVVLPRSDEKTCFASVCTAPLEKRQSSYCQYAL